MSEALNERPLRAKKQKVAVVKIERHDDKMMLPKNMSIDEAISQLRRHQEHLQQQVQLSRHFLASPWDGAAALQRVMTRLYGWVPAQKIPGLFRDRPPETVALETSLGVTEQVPWGRFGIPGVDGYIQTAYTQHDGSIVFQLQALIKRAYEGDVERVFGLVEEELRERSIYRGQAVRVKFTDDSGDALPMAEIKFMPTNVTREQLIYSRDLEAAVETNLFTPIERAEDCARNGIPVKRGVLLGGPYGTGKTMAAAVAAGLAVANGITFVYVTRADELSQAIAFARQYSNPACAVFCEDIDRVMAGERSTSMDEILNIIDGIDGKRSNIIVVLTSNFTENINPALLRPGRLDAVLEVGPPDAEAVQRLLRAYAGDAIHAETSLDEVGVELAGNIPAVIAEVVKRAKLAELRFTRRGELITGLSSRALIEAARTMTRQLKLLAPKIAEKRPTIEVAFRELIEGVVNGRGEAIEEIDRRVREIHGNVC